MINLLKYEDAEKVEITDIDNEVFVGNVIEVSDAEDKSDLEVPENSIIININGAHIEFMESEITAIKII